MTERQYTESSELERGESQQGNGNISYGSTRHYNSKNKSEGENQSFLTTSSSPSDVLDDNDNSNNDSDEDSSSTSSFRRHKLMTRYLDALTKIPLRRVALEVSLYVNLIITLIKLLAYIQTLSLSVLAALLDSVLDVVSQFVLNYTEKHSSLQRSSAFYPAGASRLEPIGVLTCAALMGMGSFEVLKQSVVALITLDNPFNHDDTTGLSMTSFWSMTAIVIVKILLLLLCQRAAESNGTVSGNCDGENGGYGFDEDAQSQLMVGSNAGSSRAVVQLADPTLEALAQVRISKAYKMYEPSATYLLRYYDHHDNHRTTGTMPCPMLWLLPPCSLRSNRQICGFSILLGLSLSQFTSFGAGITRERNRLNS